MAVSSATSANIDLAALQTSSVNELVTKLSASYDKLQPQVDAASVKVSALGQIQSGFSTIQSKASDLQDNTKTATSSDALTAFQGLLTALNAQVNLVGQLTAPASDSQDAGVLAKESGLSALATNVTQNLTTSGLYGQTVLSSLGLSQDSNGNFVLDSSAFSSAYNANPSQVQTTLSNLGASVNSSAADQIASGSAYYKSQTKAQSSYDALALKQSNIQDRINNLQYGGITASDYADYSAVTSVVSSAAKRIVALQTQSSSVSTQLSTATQQQTALTQVQTNFTNIQSSSATLSNSSNLGTAANAGSALQALVNYLNTQTTQVANYTAKAVGSTPAGVLVSQPGLVTAASAVSDLASPYSLSNINLANYGLSLSAGQYSLNLTTFNNAYASNAAALINDLVNLGSSINAEAGNQLASGSTLDKALSKVNTQVDTYNQRSNQIDTQIANVQNDPFSTVPSSSYTKILGL